MKRLAIVLAAGGLITGAGNASAGVIINFIELPDEAGIHLTGLDIFGNPIDVTKLGSETFHISSPSVPDGYSPDAILYRIGISRSNDGFLVNILDSPGGPISDQVWVHQFIPAFTVIDFLSDPNDFVLDPPFATVVETGDLQNALNYTNDRGELVSINVQSEAVPEPGSLTLLGLGLASLGVVARMKRKAKAVAP